MKLPHIYSVSSQGGTEGSLEATADQLPGLSISAPANFGGPGDQWSPEDLLVSAAANCLILSFRAIARASKLDWAHIECRSKGTLDLADGVMKFTRIDSQVSLTIVNEGDRDKAERLIHKAERSCLITNSLNCDVSMEISISV